MNVRNGKKWVIAMFGRDYYLKNGRLDLSLLDAEIVDDPGTSLPIDTVGRCERPLTIDLCERMDMEETLTAEGVRLVNIYKDAHIEEVLREMGEYFSRD